jgi:hypothetical protein
MLFPLTGRLPQISHTFAMIDPLIFQRINILKNLFVRNRFLENHPAFA